MTIVPPDDVRLEINRATRPAVPVVDVVVPVFNEQEVVPLFLARMDALYGAATDFRLRFIFVNDGSRDGTLAALWSIARDRPDVAVIDLSRNFGKEAALTAGLNASTGDAAIPIDVDLQDPPELLATFLSKWRQGYDVVLARRTERSGDSLSKRMTSAAFYGLYNAIAASPIPANVGDFRLMDRRVVEALRRLPESNRFMKGILSWVGFASTVVDYERPERVAGKSRWSYRRLLSFAMDGLLSFSSVPLIVWFYVGALAATLSLGYAAFILVRTMVYGADVPGYASLLIAILLSFSVQMVSIGVLAQYVARIFVEVKKRPHYLVSTTFGADLDRGE